MMAPRPDSATQKPTLTILLANPRGFCAGVDRAIKVVELAIEKYGAPVYVRHEIVHNRYVVESLEAKGAIFVDELDAVPDDVPVVFSAHGVPKSVPQEARRRSMIYVDATCPLVSKVHREVEYHFSAGRHILMIGHAGHPEVIGTMGQVEDGAMTLIETVEDAENLHPADPDNLAFATQTTLSVDDTADIVATLQRRFPNIAGPKKEDICYATTNRQDAVKAIAADADRVIVIGAPNSSNSRRLVEVSEKAGCRAILIQRAADLDWDWLSGARTIGITAGASAPEILVTELIDALKTRYDARVELRMTAEEDVIFKVPPILRDVA
ncbi:4-hydroxy-3-methylbut-2-enyl diphosphate reductase [Eilatimonas milleporae]|uniref:4-hydroxy-3-methylbut-2-enyl diphosphate reductase n=2 Tax=Eilatimonas milleporae TaxID=911205 RepID=A0A3M0C6V3_9PROT|nr:4-hydroxy-3-methylbut-2-enyl diphosphate reductase [Eilatimonas milleporae]RMB04645.1 4-hydroxy-3-methylbut-2-enyl diphosphate reductase [Eilatimonas milleporae]